MSLLSRFKISGHSMLPTLKVGDKVLISSFPYMFSTPKIGDIIVFKKNGKNFIKRITGVTPQGFIVAGDNSFDSISSKKLGVISKKLILGKVVYKL